MLEQLDTYLFCVELSRTEDIDEKNIFNWIFLPVSKYEDQSHIIVADINFK